jgi:hypothetical protein
MDERQDANKDAVHSLCGPFIVVTYDSFPLWTVRAVEIGRLFSESCERMCIVADSTPASGANKALQSLRARQS